jgi:hypothetical protein
MGHNEKDDTGWKLYRNTFTCWHVSEINWKEGTAALRRHIFTLKFNQEDVGYFDELSNLCITVSQ